MHVCVIGAGASGLPAMKACIEEGLDVVCYEKTSDIGGLWNYRPNDEKVGSTVMETTVVNTSKEMMAYSDFPPPAEWANFMHHSKVQEYLRLYAAKFDLLKYINFNSKVEKVEKEENGWRVELENGTSRHFDKLMICSGHHAEPQKPKLSGIERFTGKILHAQKYHNFEPFVGKNVFLLGIGNSALDIAVDLAKIAKSVTISTRRGSWIFNRVAQGGMPYDIQFMSRYYDWIMDTIPWTVANDFMEHRCQQRMDHDIYGLRPNHRFFQQHPTVNDALANLISSGYITITEDIETFTEDSVVVKGSRSFPCDVFIFCTGYTFSFPFMDSNIINIKNHEVNLYKYVFPTNCTDAAVIGLIQPIGSVAPISEIQSRWVARVFSGKVSLPNSEAMEQDMAKKKAIMRRRYFDSNKHTIQVDYVKYMDEIASLIGCRPPLKEILWKDLKFFLRLIMGPNVPYVYRMIGPNKWGEAEQAIRTVTDRVKKPLKNRQCRLRKHKKRGTTDEYFRYASMKWIAGWLAVTICTGALLFCTWPLSIPFPAFIIISAAFFLMFSFMLLWFDLQYDMSTVF